MVPDSSASRRHISHAARFIAAAAFGLLLPSLASAAEAVPGAAGNTAWVLTASALVLFMTLPGLALFYGGLVSARNLLSVLMHCFVVCCVVSLIWAVTGYSPGLYRRRAVDRNSR